MAGSRGIEPRKRASKTRGLPLAELPTIGWTGGNRTLDNWFTASQSATDLRPTYKTRWSARLSHSQRCAESRFEPATSRLWRTRRRSNPRLPGFNQPLLRLSYLSEHGGGYRNRTDPHFRIASAAPTPCKPIPRKWLRVRESNSANAAYETAVMRQLNLPAAKPGQRRGIEPRKAALSGRCATGEHALDKKWSTC